jgi:hypothetical protein
MVESGCRADFTLEPFERDGIASQLFRKEFQRDLAAQSRIFGAKHLPHPARAEGFDDSVVGDYFAYHARDNGSS